jgi:SWI/SNF-related matrix-associated actin-dependent regulator of chromatin subfamily A3
MRDRLEPKLIWATPGQRGFPSRKTATAAQVTPSGASDPTIPSKGGPGPSTQHHGLQGQTSAQKNAVRKQQEAIQKAVELRQMLNNLEKVDDESRRSSLLDTLCSTDDILNLPVHPDPPGIKNGDLKVDLLKHQVNGLHVFFLLFFLTPYVL